MQNNTTSPSQLNIVNYGLIGDFDMITNMTWKNLAPNLVRQRVIMEGTTKTIVDPDQIKTYLDELARVTKMEKLSGPYAYSAHDMGYGGWIHWKSSGAAFYSYPTNPPLFTVDCYTCKPFSAEEAAEFTKKYFNAIELVWKEVGV